MMNGCAGVLMRNPLRVDTKLAHILDEIKCSEDGSVELIYRRR